MEALLFFGFVLFAGFMAGSFCAWQSVRKEVEALKSKLQEAKTVNTMLWQGNKTLYDSYQAELRRRHDR